MNKTGMQAKLLNDQGKEEHGKLQSFSFAESLLSTRNASQLAIKDHLDPTTEIQLLVIYIRCAIVY